MILALDPGVTSGWARSDGTCGEFSVTGIDDHGQALAAFHDWLSGMFEQRRPKRFVIERGFFSRGGATANLTRYMIGTAHMIAWSHAVPRTDRPASEVRDWLLGGRKARSGMSDKQLDAAIQDAVEARGFWPKSAHAGDGAALLCYVEQRPVRVDLDAAYATRPISEAA